jgi:cytochrome P450
MMRLTLQIVGRALFSLDLNQEVGTIGYAVTTLLQLFVDYVFRPFPPLSVPTPRNRRLQQAIRSLDQVVYGLIAERRTHQIEGDDLLSTLLAVQDEETGQGMNDRQVRDEVMTLLLAGHETTANTLTWTWLCWLLGASVREICLLCTMKKALLPQHVDASTINMIHCARML